MHTPMSGGRQREVQRDRDITPVNEFLSDNSARPPTVLGVAVMVSDDDNG